jgi:transglutaminase-like putative cysteine protease
MIDRALEIFNLQFTYTMRPPGLGANPIDDFLFTSKRGFCEHFSSAFAFTATASSLFCPWKPRLVFHGFTLTG